MSQKIRLPEQHELETGVRELARLIAGVDPHASTPTKWKPAQLQLAKMLRVDPQDIRLKAINDDKNALNRTGEASPPRILCGIPLDARLLGLAVEHAPEIFDRSPQIEAFAVFDRAAETFSNLIIRPGAEKIAHQFSDAGFSDVETLVLGDRESRAQSEIFAESGETTETFSDAASAFAKAVWKAELRFGEWETHLKFVRRFLASLAVKRFVILTGSAGSGKTQLAMKLGEWCGRLSVIPV